MEIANQSVRFSVLSSVEWHKKIFALLKLWHRNAVTRKQLKDLPDHLLKDVGIDREAALQESKKSFWE